MTAQVDMVNRALQTFGSRTTVTAAQLAANSSNEAIQANIAYASHRRRLLRLAPWNCAFQTANLNYITSCFGTPENPSAQTSGLWSKGQPAPPWAYEYQYPADCLRACWVTPQTATGFASGIPITTAVTGGAPSFWQGPPVKYVVAVDQFFCVSVATPVAAGTGYAVGDYITLPVTNTAVQVINKLGTFQAGQPQGAAAILQVLTVNGSGGILTAAVVSQVSGEATALSGSYFYGYGAVPSVAAASTTGSGTGATFSLDIGATGVRDQRVILTNQEFAIINYVKDVTDENLFDDTFQEAFALVLGARLCVALTGDKSLANLTLAQANAMITEARGTDANEGLKVNDVTPDWLRVRGIDFTEDYSGPYNTGFAWGALWPGYT